MALFVKKLSTDTYSTRYSIGMSKTLVIVGLGNVGKEYQDTRHNIGFKCLDYFAQLNDFPDWTLKKDLKCQLSVNNIGETRVVLAKPTTLMNNSGEAVQAIQRFFKVPDEQTVIVHDELDIPFGQIRTRRGGGSAGNNGLKSIIKHGGGETLRIRLGIQNQSLPKIDSADFVLKKFSAEEQKHLKSLEREVGSILTEYIYGGALVVETRSFIV